MALIGSANPKSFMASRAITKKWAKTFYFASFLLSKEKRYASYAVYAICRACDHSVDDTTDDLKVQNLSKIRNEIEQAYHSAPLTKDTLIAFRETVNTYQIPKIYFDDLIDGMIMDLNKNRYENFTELRDYCYKVAGVVGLIMLKILGYEDKAAEQHAVNLGIAMQLTNILRDIKEDYALGRIYLPKSELDRFSVTEEMIAEGYLDARFKDLLVFQIKRARDHYQNATEGICLINNARSRLVVWTMADLYSGILKAIERNRYDVFSKRAYLSKFKKILRLIWILLSGRYF